MSDDGEKIYLALQDRPDVPQDVDRCTDEQRIQLLEWQLAVLFYKFIGQHIEDRPDGIRALENGYFESWNVPGPFATS